MIGGIGQRVLLQRAQDYVLRYSPQLIGITGSWGLNLTKQALAAILREYTTVRASKAAAKGQADVALNIIGGKEDGSSWVRMLGLGLIREAVDEEPKTIVTEVPVRRPGDVDTVAYKLPFSIAVATNVHATQLAYFARKELVAHEILALPVSLPKDAVAVLNIDEPLLASATDNIQARVVGFGHTPAADVQIRRLELIPGGGCTTEIKVANHFFEGQLPYAATYMQAQAMIAALAVAYAVTSNPTAIKNGFKALQSFTAPSGFGTVQEVQGLTVLGDTFNATPESMESSLRALAQMFGRKIAVLGDIADIGSKATQWYEKIGMQAAEQADIAIFVGTGMQEAQATALKSGHKVDTHHFVSSRNVSKWLADYLHSGDTVLVAGSRDMKMGVVLKDLLATE